MNYNTALITGITGQDGSYLAEHLLSMGYDVHGVIRRSSSEHLSTHRLKNIKDKITLHTGDITDLASCSYIVRLVKPSEIYNLAAQSFVPASWTNPLATIEATGIGAVNMMEAAFRFDHHIKFYQAGSSEMFGKVLETPQKETTPFYPRSPYACAKAFAHNIGRNYRESYSYYVSNGILFNHESPRRGYEFVTRKITNAVAKIYDHQQAHLHLGNLDSKRDWGFAGDYVKGMHLMLQQSRPDDFILATGKTHTVREFVDIAFKYVGLDYNEYVRIDPAFKRPAEVDLLLGDATKAKTHFGWEPTVTLQKLIEMMVEHDLSVVRNSHSRY